MRIQRGVEEQQTLKTSSSNGEIIMLLRDGAYQIVVLRTLQESSLYSIQYVLDMCFLSSNVTLFRYLLV